jgi:hypothetical protein
VVCNYGVRGSNPLAGTVLISNKKLLKWHNRLSSRGKRPVPLTFILKPLLRGRERHQSGDGRRTARSAAEQAGSLSVERRRDGRQGNWRRPFANSTNSPRMKLTPEIIGVALAALSAGLVLGYGLRSFVSLRRRRRRRKRYLIPSGPSHRMEPLNDMEPPDGWRRELETNLSKVTTAPSYEIPGLHPVS